MNRASSRHRRAARIVSLLALSASSLAAQSGTRFNRVYTFIPSGTATINFQVASGSAAATDKSIFRLEFGPDGNNAAVASNPFPTPASVTFALTKDGTAAMFTPSGGGPATPTFTAADVIGGGGINLTGVTNKAITVDYGTHGRYLIEITHNTNVTTNENWQLVINGLPSVRGIGAVDVAVITGLNPTGAATGTPEPCVCDCPFRKCLNFRYYVLREVVFPRIPDPPPECPMCDRAWTAQFDRERFERTLVTFVPTREQRAALEKSKDFRFRVEGGEALGEVREGGSGEFIQMIQHPRGQPPLVIAESQGVALAEVRAEPPRTADGGTRDKVIYGLGGLILGALAAALGIRRRPGTSGPDRMA